MFIRMLPEQIADYWDVIKYAIEGSLPPIANEAYNKMNRILEALLAERMQCWVSYREEEKRILEAIVVTTITGDFCSEAKNLMIYSLYGFNLTEEAWSEGFAALAKWGKAHGCIRVVAYTDVDRIKEVVKSLGGESRYTLISIPL